MDAAEAKSEGINTMEVLHIKISLTKGRHKNIFFAFCPKGGGGGLSENTEICWHILLKRGGGGLG